MYDDVANCTYPSFAALYDLIVEVNISPQTHTASHRDFLHCSIEDDHVEGSRIAGFCTASDDWMLMRWSPATPALACISALYQPLKQANYIALMSVDTGTIRDGSSAQKSAAWRSNRRANPPHGVDGWGSWPGLRARISFPRQSNGCAKGSKRAEVA